MLSQILRVLNINAVTRFTAQRQRFTSTGRSYYILGIKLSGRSMHHFSDRSEILEANHVYFFHRDDFYSVEVLELGKSFSVHFTALEPVEVKSFFAPVSDPENVIHRLERLEQVFLTHGCCADSLCELYRLISFISNLLPDSQSEKIPQMEDAREYMHLHFKEKDCIAEAARIYGVTPRRFTDLFRQSYRCTPGRYLTQLKLEKAKQLLEMAELSLAQVAELSGFSDVYYFSKVFKQEIGDSPGVYRKRQERPPWGAACKQASQSSQKL